MHRFGKLMIVDGSYALHRSLHVKEIFELRGPNGQRTGGIFGFLKTLSHEFKKCPEYFPVICFDEGLAPRRVAADPYYKHADERADKSKQIIPPEELDSDYLTQYKKQRNSLITVLTHFGIPCLKFVPWEGDDLMYYLSKNCEECVVVTDDRDLLQLLSPTCKVRRPMADETWTLDSFLENKGYGDIQDFITEKAIIGDSSDNIPSSCKGVGAGTVGNLVHLLNEFSEDGEYCDISHDEESLKNICSDIGIKYRGAFVNFDYNRFMTNIELVDLNKVVVPQDVQDSINETIINCKSHLDYFKVVALMKYLGIKELSVDEVIQVVNSRYHNLLLEG